MIRTKWPKLQPVAEYIQLNYTAGAIARASVIRQIQAHQLPGTKVGGRWFIYILPDGSPAYGYSENKPEQPKQEKVELTGNAQADAILVRLAANNGFKVA